MTTAVVVAIVVAALGALMVFRPAIRVVPTRDAIVPRLKNEAYLAVFSGVRVEPTSAPAYEPLIADVLVAFALDLPGAFKMLTAGDMIELGMDLDEVRATAIGNLRQRMPEIGSTPVAPDVEMLGTGDGLEACLLLLDEVWERFESAVRGELVVAVPTREIVLITGSDSLEGLAHLRAAVDEAQRTEPTHRVTRNLLVRRDGRWAVFTTPR